MKALNFKGTFRFYFLTSYFSFFLSIIAFAQSGLSTTIEIQLNNVVADGKLNFPTLTQKVYKNKGFQPLWFEGLAPGKLLWEASDLINAAPNYGLDRSDYHNDQLSANFMKELTQSSLASSNYKALLDILATDAMLAMIAHLHYGRANPDNPQKWIDLEKAGAFKPDSLLLSAVSSPDFRAVILSSQPDFKGYKELQNYLESGISQWGSESDLSPETVKLLSLNLERWRWISSVTGPYVHINIPAFTMQYIKSDKSEDFKVIIGKPHTSTPVLRSRIGYFTTAPDWTVPKNIAVKELLLKAIRNPEYLESNNFRVYDKKGNTINPTVENLKMVRSKFSSYVIKQSPGCDNALGQIVFNFENSYSVYLHDTPDRSLFNRTDRALSHGCIRVENPEKLAALFLEQDNASEKIRDVHKAMKSYTRTRTVFEHPIPIIISYLTCDVRDGVLTKYKDLYNKDIFLEKNLRMLNLSKL